MGLDPHTKSPHPSKPVNRTSFRSGRAPWCLQHFDHDVLDTAFRSFPGLRAIDLDFQATGERWCTNDLDIIANLVLK